MNLLVNGKMMEIEGSASIADFLQNRGLDKRLVVVEHNLEIVPRERHSDVMLQPGDRLEIVQMMAGG